MSYEQYDWSEFHGRGSYIKVDGELRPLYEWQKNPWKHTTQLIDGTFAEQDVVVFCPAECRVIHKTENGFTGIEKEEIVAKSVKFTTADEWPWYFFFWSFWMVMRDNPNMGSSSFPRFRHEVYLADRTIDMCAIWGKQKDMRDILWEKIYPYRNPEYCKYWKDDVLGNDYWPKDGEDGRHYPEFYPNVSIDLVCESDNVKFFVTEKTLRPIICGKIPLVYSIKDYYKNLVDIGYTLHPEIDYGFDSIADDHARADALLGNVLALKVRPDRDSATAEVRRKNLIWVLDIILEKDLPMPEGFRQSGVPMNSDIWEKMYEMKTTAEQLKEIL